MEFLLKILLVFFFVLLNGYFVASEFALVSVRKTRIDELAKKGDKRAQYLQKSLHHLDSYISSTQLGITIASLALGWIGEPAIAHLIEPLFRFLPDTLALISSHTFAVIIAFAIITFLHIVLGELAPKTLALQRSESVSLLVIIPLILFTNIFKPIIYLLNESGNLVLKLLGLHSSSSHHAAYSEEEVMMILEESKRGGRIPHKEVEMVHNVFNLGDIPVQSIMVPRTDVVAFDMTTSIEKALKKIQKITHSRFPVFDTSIDTIIGFVHVKDLYKVASTQKGDKKLEDAKIIREIISVPETKKADKVMIDMRKKRTHIAVVLDEYGGTAGIVTLEDIIESLVGEIEDEFERPIQMISKKRNGSYVVDGRVSVGELKDHLQIPISGQGYHTVAGLMFGMLGREPKVLDKVQIGDITFQVHSMEGKRINSVLISQSNKKKDNH